MTTPKPPIPWEPPIAGTEVEHLCAALERQRSTFRWKAAGLDAAGLHHTIASSSLSLAGLLKHLALVEDYYFVHRLAGRPWPAEWREHDGSQEWPFVSAADDEPESLYSLHDAAVARAREALRTALDGGGLDQLVDVGWPTGERPSLRRMLCDLIEEYGRHTGHADLIREDIDGRVGEDPPQDWRW